MRAADFFACGWLHRKRRDRCRAFVAALPAAFRRLAGGGIALAAVMAAGTGAARAGHEVGFYPSFYPHEIRIEVLAPEAAAGLLSEKTLHAYLGPLPSTSRAPPGHLRSADSLGSLLLLDFNPKADIAASAESRCAAARAVLGGLGAGREDFVLHPYPVTPYHADYLHHLDRIETARAAVAGQAPEKAPRVRAAGAVAEAILPAAWRAASDDWEMSLGEVDLADFLASTGIQLNGWLGPPWVKEGWFQAYAMLAPALADGEDQRAAAALYRDLTHNTYRDLAEQIDLERQLVAALTRGCHRLVVGYTVRRESYNADDFEGIENVAFDSQSGLNAPVFVRTVKLKDFPWNGSVRLGIAGGFGAAWNPVGGFSDPAGRLVWAALSDAALIPVPYNSGWIPNRVDVSLERANGGSGGFAVPEDAVLPEPGTGLLGPVPLPGFGSARLVYQVIVSPFLDGSETELADLLYAYAFAWRWSARAAEDDPTFDPWIAATSAAMRERLLGLRLIRMETAVNRIAPDIEVIQQRPLLEVFLAEAPGDAQQVAALAPPWSTVPWHLLALMEEMVIRGEAAFTEAEARRRGVPWLDLARDPAMRERMRALIAEFAAAGYRPAPLANLVTEDEARARWQALGAFLEANGHLLVTNGPYRLDTWQPKSVTLAAVREMTYPLGFGTFDRYVEPLHAVVREVERDADTITLRVDVEKTVKVGRHYQMAATVPLDRTTARGTYGALIVSRYLLVGPDGRVVAADKMEWQGDDRLRVALPAELPPGRYTFLAAVYLDGNAIVPSPGMLHFDVPQ